MGAGLIAESLSFLHGLEHGEFEQHFGNVRFGPYGFTGMSMGAHMACLAASMAGREVALVPCLSPYSASVVFTQGPLRNWCHWDVLRQQLEQYQSAEQRERRQSAEEFMVDFLHNSDITTYPAPVYAPATIQVAARHDGYIPGTGDVLYRHWHGSELRWIPTGHATAFVLGSARAAIVEAILDAFRRVHHRLYSHDGAATPSSPSPRR